MKMFNRYIAILCTLAPIALSAVENFDLINANYALPNAPIIYYTCEIKNLATGTSRVPKTDKKQLRGIFNLRADIKEGELLSLELSADPAMAAANVKNFDFSPELLQDAVTTLKVATGQLAVKKNKTAEDKKWLELAQKGAVKATTCYITASVKSPRDKTIVLSPQNPTTQYSKQTAQGLPLYANVSGVQIDILENNAGVLGKLSPAFVQLGIKNGIPLVVVNKIRSFIKLWPKLAAKITKKNLGNPIDLLNGRGETSLADVLGEKLNVKHKDLIKFIQEHFILNSPHMEEITGALAKISKQLPYKAGSELAFCKYYEKFAEQFEKSFPALYKELKPGQLLFFVSMVALPAAEEEAAGAAAAGE